MKVRHTIFLQYIIVTTILLMGAVSVGFAVDDLDRPQFRKGYVVFKVSPEYQVKLPIKGAERFGVAHIDEFMDKVGATWVERKFPHTPDPKPGRTDLTRIYNLKFPEAIDVKLVSSNLSKLKGIEYAEPWYINYLCYEHNDPDREDQWPLDLLEADRAHDITTGDPDVVIAITDNGTQMDHPDLIENIWHNPDEEENGADSDRNGFRDDVVGWDFAGNDNDPNDAANHGHGTHTAGISSAVTDNEIGISSIGFNCQLMIVRCGHGNAIPFGYEAIVYATDNGAKVINCSWGGSQANQAGREAVQHAHEEDVIIIAAAGNNNRATLFYPAGFQTVVSITATTSRDVKASFSNYGNWVDLAAPGDGIRSTFLNNGYRNMDGTSMASPFVAGVAGLLRSEYPEMNAVQTRLFLRAGVNDIDDPRMGTGRCNAYRALVAIENPIVEIVEFELSEEENGNDKPDPGERVEFEIELTNYGRDATELVGFMSTDDESINIVEGQVDFPDLQGGRSVKNWNSPFVIEVAENTIPHTTHVTVRVVGQPNDFEIEERYELLIGHPAVLLVDDDNGGNYEEMFGPAINNINQGYQRWDVLMNDYPNAETLLDHPIVIWLTGDAYPPLDSDERWTMQNAIASGANILLMGKWIGDNINENGAFLRQSFGVNHDTDSLSAVYVRGLGGETPVPENVEIHLSNPDLGEADTLNATISPSGMRTRFNSHPLLNYVDSNDEVAGIAGIYQHVQETNSHTVYLGFNLEMASDFRSPRALLVAHILDWMTDYASSPIPDPTDPVTFSLDPAYPNPFNNVVSINFRVPSRSDYRLSVFDLSGREIALLNSGTINPGSHKTIWDASGVTSGVYLARLAAPGISTIEQKLVLVK